MHYLHFIDDLINSYLLTGNPGTPKAFETAFNQWYDQLDSVKTEQVIHMIRSYDFVWYELGLANRNERLINAQRVFGPHLSPETNKRLLKIILGSTRWLDQCLQRTPFHPYNWQTHTALTVSYAAVAYPEFREAGSWLDRGRTKSIRYRGPIYKAFFAVFIVSFLILGYLGVEPTNVWGEFPKGMPFCSIT